MSDDVIHGPAQRGWLPVLKKVAHNVSANRLTTEAAAVTFYGLLAVFPALAALVSLFGLFADPKVVADQVNALRSILPDGAMELLSGELHTLTTSSGKTLGLGAVLGVAMSLWTANNATKSIFGALNAAYGETETRGFVRLTLVSLALTFFSLVFIIVAIGVVVALPAVLGFLGLGTAAEWLVLIARWPIMLAAIVALLSSLYALGPSRGAIRWRWLSVGSLVAAILWLIVSAAFSWYVAHFGSYNKTYGSLGAVVGFMTWIWISSTVVLVGAAIDAESEREDSAQAA
jgi:membrane protein